MKPSDVTLAVIAKTGHGNLFEALASAAPYVSRNVVIVEPLDTLFMPSDWYGMIARVGNGSFITRPRSHTKARGDVRFVQHETLWFAAPWEGYSAQRNRAIALAEGFSPWVLTLDTDDRFAPDGSLPPEEEVDAFDLPVITLIPEDRKGEQVPVHLRPHLTRRGRGWYFRGRADECLRFPGPYTLESGERAEGRDTRVVRRWDGLTYLSAPGHVDRATFERKAALLMEDLAVDPTNPRSYFYLARALEALDNHGAALQAYSAAKKLYKRPSEETYWTLVGMGRCARALGFPLEATAALMRDAFVRFPERAEALRDLAALYREAGMPLMAQDYAEKADACAVPRNARLFVELSAYKETS